MENTFFFNSAKLMNATQFPRMYQHNMLIPWNKYLSCGVNANARLHTLNHATLLQPRRQASWLNWKNISNPETQSILAIWRWKGVGGRDADHPEPPPPQAILSLQTCFHSFFHLTLQTTWEDGLEKYCFLQFYDQKIRSKNDRLPKEAGRKSTRLLFFWLHQFCAVTGSANL